MKSFISLRNKLILSTTFVGLSYNVYSGSNISVDLTNCLQQCLADRNVLIIRTQCISSKGGPVVGSCDNYSPATMSIYSNEGHTREWSGREECEEYTDFGNDSPIEEVDCFKISRDDRSVTGFSIERKENGRILWKFFSHGNLKRSFDFSNRNVLHVYSKGDKCTISTGYVSRNEVEYTGAYSCPLSFEYFQFYNSITGRPRF